LIDKDRHRSLDKAKKQEQTTMLSSMLEGEEIDKIKTESDRRELLIKKQMEKPPR
jgi:hypothetical protein